MDFRAGSNSEFHVVLAPNKVRLRSQTYRIVTVVEGVQTNLSRPQHGHDPRFPICDLCCHRPGNSLIWITSQKVHARLCRTCRPYRIKSTPCPSSDSILNGHLHPYPPDLIISFILKDYCMLTSGFSFYLFIDLTLFNALIPHDWKRKRFLGTHESWIHHWRKGTASLIHPELKASSCPLADLQYGDVLTKIEICRFCIWQR